MISFQIKNYDIGDAQQTLLTAAVAAAIDTLPVQNVVGFAADDFVVAGNYGSEGAQLRQIGSITDLNIVLTADLTRALSSGDTVIRLLFDKVILQESVDGSTGWADVVTMDVAVDQDFTNVEYASGDSAKYYRAYFKNSVTSAISEYGSAILGAGSTEGTLGWFKEECARDIKDAQFLSVLPDEWDAFIRAATRLLFPTIYQPVTKDLSSSALTYSYTFPSGISWVDRIFIFSGTQVPQEYEGRIFNNSLKFDCDIGAGYTIRLEGREYFTAPTNDASALGVQKMHYELLKWQAEMLALQAILLDKNKMNQYAAEVKGTTENDVMNTLALLRRNIEDRRSEVAAPIQAYDMRSPTA